MTTHRFDGGLMLNRLAAAERARAALAEGEALAAAGAATVDLPEAKGEVTPRKAAKLFAMPEPLFAFDVPTFHWSACHPHVPAVDPGYLFRPMELFRVLMALVSNQRAYLHGHTGTGKTTLVGKGTTRRLAGAIGVRLADIG